MRKPRPKAPPEAAVPAANEPQAAFLAGDEGRPSDMEGTVESSRLNNANFRIVTDVFRMGRGDRGRSIERQYVFRFNPAGRDFSAFACDPNYPDCFTAEGYAKSSHGHAMIGDKVLRGLLPSPSFRTDRFYGWSEANWGLEFNEEDSYPKGTAPGRRSSFIANRTAEGPVGCACARFDTGKF